MAFLAIFTVIFPMNAAAGSLTRPDAAASPPEADQGWSCQQSQWADCIEVVIDPPVPCAGQLINISVIAKKPDDFIRTAVLHYAYAIPHANRTPSISYYDLRMQNVSSAANREAWVELSGYLGGTRIELFVDVYDLKNERLHSEPQFVEVCGYNGWPDVCPVPSGFDVCVDLEFGYFAGAQPVALNDHDEIPQYAPAYVRTTSKFGVPMSSASIIYGLYRPGSDCDDPAKLPEIGPNYESIQVERPNRTKAILDTLSSGEPGLVLCFTLAASDDYSRTLVSRNITLTTGSEGPTCRPQILALTVVVRIIDERIGTIQGLDGVRVIIRNSTGHEIANFTDTEGIAGFWMISFPSSRNCQGESWTISAFYQGAISEIRVGLPDRERERSGNYTFYLTFLITADHHPLQEAADPGYFAWMAAGLLGFIAIFAPLAARHFVEKRRREELRRSEKEQRFKL